MTPDAERENLVDPKAGNAYVRQQLASIDGSMFNGMPSDDRFESGVPEGQRGNSLDFIQMTGLTRPPLRQSGADVDGSLARTPVYSDLNASEPLSFYEKGVADVDDTLAGERLHGGMLDASLDSDLVPNRSSESLNIQPGASQSVQAFRDIVAGLQASGPRADLDTQEESDDIAAEDESEYNGSASGSLLSLLEELESAMKAPTPEAPTPEAPTVEAATPEPEPDASDEAPNYETPDYGAMAAAHADLEVASEPENAPEPDEADTSFDDLIGALSMPEYHAEPEDAEPDALTEDWDALLDSVALSAPAAASPPPATPTPPAAPVAKLQSSKGALAEAEQLMQALERKPVVHTAAPVPALIPPSPAPEVPGTNDDAIAEPDTESLPAYDFSAAPSRRRSRRHSRIARRGRRIAKAIAFFALLGGALGSLWYFVAAPMLLQADDVAVRAAKLMEAREYTEASKAFQQLASHMPAGETARADAEFHAAYALTLGPEHSADDTRQRYEQALTLFQKFTEDYPQHAKRARALSIMGRLYFQLQDFENAISMLRDQVKPSEDPAAALSMLRYLARAYSMTGHYEEAETSYLQAATLPGNYSAESDYLELGDLFRRRAGLAEADEAAERALMEETAVSYWRRALQVPGVAPAERAALEERLQWLSYTETNAANAAAAAEAMPAAEPGHPAVPMDTPATEAPTGIPVPVDEAGRAEVPGAELEALIAPAGAPQQAAPAEPAAATEAAPPVAAEAMEAPAEVPGGA